MTHSAQASAVEALIFDMDGTMIDSMPSHTVSWQAFAVRHGQTIDIADLMRRTTGRTGVECMRELFQKDLSEAQATAYVAEKEALYRELFAPKFSEVPGFKTFAALAQARGLKVGVGTAGDRHNIAFAYANLQMPLTPIATGQATHALPRPCCMAIATA